MKKIKSCSIAFVLFAGMNPFGQATVTTGFILPTRYYDAAQGRFISADSVVPNANDPQSLNRYAYVRNNPVIYSDPSGHSWLSKTADKIGAWTDKHSEFTGLTLQTFDPFFGSAYLSRSENGRAILAGQILVAGAFWLGGTQVGWGAISGELSSAYVAKKQHKNIMEAIIIGGLEGAAISGTFAKISSTDASWIAKGFVKANISAMVTAAQGGDTQDMGRSWAFTFGAEAASSYFTKTVGYAADPTPGMCLETPNYTYSYSDIQPPQGMDVFGSNAAGPVTFFHQGSPAMRSISMLPGANAVAELHDTWRNLGAANITTMIPAFVISYAAQFAGPLAPMVSLSQR